MFYGVFKEHGKCYGGVYEGWAEYYADTFSSDTEIMALFDFKAHGKTYAEKKENVRNNAIDYSNTCGEINLSYGELSDIQDYFERYGKRYGLLEEFRENVIC